MMWLPCIHSHTRSIKQSFKWSIATPGTRFALGYHMSLKLAHCPPHPLPSLVLPWHKAQQQPCKSATEEWPATGVGQRMGGPSSRDGHALLCSALLCSALLCSALLCAPCTQQCQRPVPLQCDPVGPYPGQSSTRHFCGWVADAVQLVLQRNLICSSAHSACHFAVF